MKWTIIADSSCDLRKNDVKTSKFSFHTIPLVITVNGKDFIDDESLNTQELVDAMKASKGAPLTACPSPEAYADAMRAGGENIICITITSKLSGSYNSARLAAETVMQENPKKNIFVLDSLATSSAMIIIINHLSQLIESEKYSFDEVVEKIKKVRTNTRLRFLLHDLSNLVKTGRMSKVKGIIASVMNIKLICGENGEGEIQQYGTTLGTKKAVNVLSDCVQDKVKAEGKNIPVVITHCHNEEDASLLKKLLETKFGLTNIKTYLMRGLTSFYSNDKGLILAY